MSETPKLIVFGINGFAQMIAAGFESFGNRKVVAHTVHERFVAETLVGTRPVVAFERLSAEFDPAEHEIFIAIEHARQNAARAEILNAAKSQGYRPASLISPSALIASDVFIGEHCLVLEGAIIQYGSQVGENNFIFAQSFFGQGVRVGDHNYFGSGFFSDRNVSIGSFNTFGTKVRIAESVRVESWSFIKPFFDLEQNILEPTIIHPSMRSAGRVVDRRAHVL